MKLLRKYTQFLASFMILSLLLVSCAPAMNNQESPDTKYSGEEIFTGLFFFQNDIAKSIPQLDEVAVRINEVRAQDADVDLYLDEVSAMTTDYIAESYPTFFEELQRAMYSGDHYQIQQYLNTSSKLIEQAVLTSEKYAAVYAVGQVIGQDAELMAKIQALDLTTEADQEKLEKMLDGIEGMEQVDSKAVGLVAVVAGFYLLAAAVNTVVAAYYVIAAAAVVTAVAFWDVFELNEEGTQLGDELLVAELNDFFSK